MREVVVADCPVLKAYTEQHAQAFADFAWHSFCWRHFEKSAFEKHLNEFWSRDTRVLDAGCGAGRILRLLIEKGIPAAGITAVDGSYDILEIARREYPLVAFECQDIRHLNLRARDFKLVTAHMVFQHLDNDGLAVTLKNMYDHMASGGILFFVVTHPFRHVADKPALYRQRDWQIVMSPWGTPMQDFQRPIMDYINITIAAGFRIEAVDGLNVPPSAEADDPQEYGRYAKLAAARLAIKARKVE